jgi:hypothetical protein
MLASLSHSLDERRKRIDVTTAVAVHLNVESRSSHAHAGKGREPCTSYQGRFDTLDALCSVVAWGSCTIIGATGTSRRPSPGASSWAPPPGPRACSSAPASCRLPGPPCAPTRSRFRAVSPSSVTSTTNCIRIRTRRTRKTPRPPPTSTGTSASPTSKAWARTPTRRPAASATCPSGWTCASCRACTSARTASPLRRLRGPLTGRL